MTSNYLRDWRSTTEGAYPVGTVFTAGTATWTKTETGWVWEHPDRPGYQGAQSDFAVSRLIDQGRIWLKREGER